MSAPASRFQPERSDAPPGRCAVCGGANCAREYRANGVPAEEGEFWVLRCPDCGFGWTDPSLPDAEIGKWYPAAYYGEENVRFNPAIEAMVQVLHRRRAEAIARRAPPGPVLDVGCGRGFIPGHLKAMGYEAHGVEISDDAAWHARNRLGIDVHVGPLADAPWPAGHFNAVVFWHTLEHFRRPVETLEAARRLLKPGGLLVVAVPNSDSVQGRLFGADWFHLDVPRHYTHFGKRSLEALVTRLGFRVYETRHFTFEQNPYGFLQSLYNGLGFEWNFLYSIIKNQTSRLVPLRAHPFQAAAILGSLPLTMPLALGMSVLEAVLRAGGTIETYAYRE